MGNPSDFRPPAAQVVCFGEAMAELADLEAEQRRRLRTRASDRGR